MKSFEDYLKETGEVGHVSSILKSIFYVSGLPKVKLGELIITEGEQQGMVQAVSEDFVEVMTLTSERILPGMRVTRAGQTLKVPLSSEVLGRVINPFGHSLDGLGPILGEKVHLPIERAAPGIEERVMIERQLDTGVSLVDLLIPVGMGQRQLILGDQKTGRTTLLLQAAVSFAKKGGVCVYVGAGKKISDMKRVEEYLKKMGVFQNCVVVFASSADPASLVYLAPFTGFVVAEFFRDQGRDTLILLDDLTTHAKFYREISLLSKRMPARESYPGDIFHLHAKLLERAGLVKHEDGLVSITALPAVETVSGDLTGYLPTNAMAMTDGHLFFDTAEFKKGKRPAINISLSVTRVGNQTQTPLEKEMRRALVEKLNLYKKAQDLARFGIDLPLKTRTDLNLGERLEALFDQETHTVIEKPLILLIFGLALSGFWFSKQIEQVRVERSKLVEAYNKGQLKEISGKAAQAANLEGLQNILKEGEEGVNRALYSTLPKEKEESKVEVGEEV